MDDGGSSSSSSPWPNSPAPGRDHPIWNTLGFREGVTRKWWVATAEDGQTQSLRFGCRSASSDLRGRFGHACPACCERSAPNIGSSHTFGTQHKIMEHASRCSSIDEEVLADTWSEVLVSLEARDDVRCAEKNVSRLRSMSLSVETMADMPVLESPLSSYVIDGNSQSPCSPTSDSASPPGTMRSSKSKVTKRSRLEKTLHLHVDIDILRAVPLRSTLRNFGSLWRMDPGKISKKELQKVFMKSRPSTSYDMFLSHTWVTGGRPKYISILLRFHWHKMLIGWCIATLLAVILVLTGHLRFHLFSSIDLNMSDPPEVPMAPWAMTSLGW
eukprot:symbB.v1.2.021426.t1/scaffold1844.1/size99053/6